MSPGSVVSLRRRLLSPSRRARHLPRRAVSPTSSTQGALRRNRGNSSPALLSRAGSSRLLHGAREGQEAGSASRCLADGSHPSGPRLGLHHSRPPFFSLAACLFCAVRTRDSIHNSTSLLSLQTARWDHSPLRAPQLPPRFSSSLSVANGRQCPRGYRQRPRHAILAASTAVPRALRALFPIPPPNHPNTECRSLALPDETPSGVSL